MSTNQNSNAVPKFSIDFSQNKYPTRYARLMNILFFSGELPSNLYIKVSEKNTGIFTAKISPLVLPITVSTVGGLSMLIILRS